MSSENIRRSLNKINEAVSEHQEAVRRLQLAIHYYSEAKSLLMMVEPYIRDSRNCLQTVIDIGKIDAIVKTLPKSEAPLSPSALLNNMEDAQDMAKSAYQDAPDYNFTKKLNDCLEHTKDDAYSLLTLQVLAKNLWAKTTHDYSSDEESENESEDSEASDESEPVIMTEKVIQRRLHPKNRTQLFLTCMNPFQGYIKVGRGGPLPVEPGYYRLDMNHTQMCALRQSDESAQTLILNGYAKKMSGRIFYNREKNAVEVEVSPSGNYYY